MTICPLMKVECETTECAWKARDGECAVKVLMEIVDRLWDITAALRSVK